MSQRRWLVRRIVKETERSNHRLTLVEKIIMNTKTLEGRKSIPDHPIVSQAEWLEARKGLLTKEKEFTRLRDRLSQERRELPWVKVEKEYAFDGPGRKGVLPAHFGPTTLMASACTSITAM